MFEQTDVIGAYWHPYIQIKAKLIEPPGEVRPETEIYWRLAQRLGFTKAEIEERIPAPSDAAVEAWLESRLEPFSELSLERLRKGPILAPGTQEVAWSDLVFPTPSGKIELFSEEAGARWGADPLPTYGPNVERPATGGTPQTIRSSSSPPTPKNRIHSQFGNLPSIRAIDPDTFADMSPVDAAARGIVDDDRVRVFNDRGKIEVSGTPRSQPAARVHRDPQRLVAVRGRRHQPPVGRPRDRYGPRRRLPRQCGRGGARTMSHGLFVLDLDRCTGCAACVVACNTENEVAEGMSWRRIHTFNQQRLATAPVFHFTLACNHCLSRRASATVRRTPTPRTRPPGRCSSTRIRVWAAATAPGSVPTRRPSTAPMSESWRSAPSASIA